MQHKIHNRILLLINKIWMLKNYLSYIFALILVFSSCANNSDEPDSVNPPTSDLVDLKVENLIGDWEVYYATQEVFKYGNSGGIAHPDPTIKGFMVSFVNGTDYYETNAIGVKTVEGTYAIIGKDTIALTFKKKDRYGVLTNIDTTAYRHIIRDPLTGTFVQSDRYMLQAANDERYSVEDITKFRNINNTPSTYPNQPDLILKISDLYGTWVQTKAQTQRGEYVIDSVKYHGTKMIFNLDSTFETYLPPASGGSLSEAGKFYLIDDVVHLTYKYYDQNTQAERDTSSTFWIPKREGGITSNKFVVYDRFVIYENKNLVTVTLTDVFER